MPTDADNKIPVMFARTDDPDHHRLRRMMTGNFTFRRCESMRPQIQENGRPRSRRDNRQRATG
jgi:cytochrome P450